MAISSEELNQLSGDKSYAVYLQKARNRFEKGEAATAAEVRKVYRQAAALVRQDIKKVASGTLRQAHLEALAKNLDDRARGLNKNILAAAHKGIWLSVETGAEGAAKISEQLLQNTFDTADVRRLFAGINERATLVLLARTGKDGLKLSDRVWRTSEKWRNAARRVVEDGVARGLNARKLAKEVERYLQPGVWTALKAETRRRLGVAKDVSYEGMRLARTEMNNAFHEGSILANRATPSYEGIYWRLSGSHPLPDVCDDYASHGGNGFWPKREEPVRPHPQCFCVTFPAHQPPEIFADRLKSWIKDPGSDTKLETWYNDIARQVLKRPVPASLVAPVIQETVLSKVLKEKEAEIVGLDYERAYVFSKEGNILLRKNGERSSVKFLPDELTLFKNAVFTHNHPRGNSFSIEDILLSIEYDIVEVRAASQKHIHSMLRPKSGWPEANILFDEYNKANRNVREEFLRKIDLKQMTADEASREHFHQVWLRVAKTLKLNYKRELR